VQNNKETDKLMYKIKVKKYINLVITSSSFITL